jgi:hypothetical protein
MSAGYELEKTIRKVSKWYKAFEDFPVACMYWKS